VEGMDFTYSPQPPPPTPTSLSENKANLQLLPDTSIREGEREKKVDGCSAVCCRGAQNRI